MPLAVAELFAAAVQLYAVAGAVFALPFAWRGAGALDPAARTGSPGFRLLILPGSAALWPLLLIMWVRASDYRVRASDYRMRTSNTEVRSSKGPRDDGEGHGKAIARRS